MQASLTSTFHVCHSLASVVINCYDEEVPLIIDARLYSHLRAPPRDILFQWLFMQLQHFPSFIHWITTLVLKVGMLMMLLQVVGYTVCDIGWIVLTLLDLLLVISLMEPNLI